MIVSFVSPQTKMLSDVVVQLSKCRTDVNDIRIWPTYVIKAISYSDCKSSHILRSFWRKVFCNVCLHLPPLLMYLLTGFQDVLPRSPPVQLLLHLPPADL